MDLRSTAYYLRHPTCPWCEFAVEEQHITCHHCHQRVLVDHYRLIRRITQSSVSILFEAIDLDKPRKRFMVKYMALSANQKNVESIDDDLLGLNLMQGLTCVPSNKNGGWLEQEAQFIIFPFVRGQLLRDIRQWDAAKVMGFLDASLALLEAMHNRSIFSRNFTPNNLIYTDKEQLFLIDYGVFSPEQHTGFAAPEFMQTLEAHRRSDLYHVAATAYSLINGGTPPHPQHRHLLRPESGLPKDLRETLNTMLNPEMRRRPLSATHAWNRLLGHQSPRAMILTFLLIGTVLLVASIMLAMDEGRIGALP